jgi:hypothetical protein
MRSILDRGGAAPSAGFHPLHSQDIMPYLDAVVRMGTRTLVLIPVFLRTSPPLPDLLPNRINGVPSNRVTS